VQSSTVSIVKRCLHYNTSYTPPRCDVHVHYVAYTLTHVYDVGLQAVYYDARLSYMCGRGLLWVWAWPHYYSGLVAVSCGCDGTARVIDLLSAL